MKVNQISAEILEEIKNSIASKDFGSVEIYIESGAVVQITERTIKKTNNLKSKENNIRTYHSNVRK